MWYSTCLCKYYVIPLLLGVVLKTNEYFFAIRIKKKVLQGCENCIFSSDFAETMTANLWKVQEVPFLVKFNSDTSESLQWTFQALGGNHVMKINSGEQHLVLMPWAEEAQLKLLFF